jgi:putative NADH-flavin reductase
MKIVVLGASRGVGLQVVKRALESGHTVTAFVRSPEKFEIKHANLSVMQGDSTDAAAVERAIAGQDAVVSALGPTRPPVPHMMETSARNIVAAMGKHGVRRLISTTGAGVRQPEDQPQIADRLIGLLLNLLVKEIVLDSAANVRVLQASDLDWTVVRFPRLVDGARTGKYRAGFMGKGSGTKLVRADGADFIVKELEERRWQRRAPLVSAA